MSHPGRNKAFQCNKCEAKFKCKYILAWHGVTHLSPSERKANRCNPSKTTFPSSDKLQKHQMRKCQASFFPCVFCTKAFRAGSEMEDHLRTHTGERPFECFLCGKGFPSRGEVTIHMICHTEERPFECEYCKKRFKWRTNLKCHRRIHLESISTRSFKCSTCLKVYKTNLALKMHKKIHSRETLPCKFCPKLFRTNMELESHTRTHTMEKPFECPSCKKCFRQQETRRKHEMVGCGRSFKCRVCQEVIKGINLYRKHIKNHKTQKDFVCIFCGRGFSFPKKLFGHLYTHTREKPYFCKICPYSCTSTTNLKLHQKKHQNGHQL